MSEIRIGWMFPDTLFLHGERGNLLALARFARMGGLEPRIDKVDFSTEDFDPAEFDILFFGPGEISSFPAVMGWLYDHKDGLADFINAGKPLIATGTTVAMFCRTILRADGKKMSGLWLFSSDYIENDKVYGDDIYFRTLYNDRQMEIIGNQIQMGDLILNRERSFGDLIYGYGNTGKDMNEGVIKMNSIFTNTLGPMLVCNPWLTIEIIRVAAANKGLEPPEIKFDDKLERDSFETKKEFIKTKETNLKNCKR